MQFNRALFTVFIIVALGTCSSTVFGHSAGPLDNYAANPPGYTNCTACHTSFPVNSGIGTVAMVFPPLNYISGAIMPVDITVADALGMRWGFEMTVKDFAGSSAGQFIVTDPVHTQLSDNPVPNLDFVKQTSMGTFNGSGFGVAWPILWQAPVSVWPVTFYFSGNGANGDGSALGDYIYTDSLVVNAASAVIVDVRPTGVTSFGASGGTLNWDIELESWSGLPADTIDLWVDVTLPNGIVFGPILGPVLGFAMPGLPPPVIITRPRTTNIPSNAPVGNYMMNAYIGQYNPPMIRAEAHFPFFKTADDGSNGDDFLGFSSSGESFETTQVVAELPQSALLLRSYPNPFNPTTNISFNLPISQKVKLSVLDITGRTVVELLDGWREVGTHELTFDASDLPSGLYLLRLETDDATSNKKLILLK